MGEKYYSKLWHIHGESVRKWRSNLKCTDQNYQEGRKGDMQNHAKVDSGLPALVVALCSKSSKCSDTNRMPCRGRWFSFSVVWVSFIPFRPQPLNWKWLRFVPSLRLTSSNVLHLCHFVHFGAVSLIHSNLEWNAATLRKVFTPFSLFM